MNTKRHESAPIAATLGLEILGYCLVNPGAAVVWPRIARLYSWGFVSLRGSTEWFRLNLNNWRCGIESELKDALVETPRSFSRKTRLLCPGCWLLVPAGEDWKPQNCRPSNNALIIG